ncbi:MAG: glycoside hydrolase, partial [Ignisphaera sp.]
MKKELIIRLILCLIISMYAYLYAADCIINVNTTYQRISCIGASSAWNWVDLNTWGRRLFEDNELDGYIGLSSLRARIDPTGNHAPEVNNLVRAKSINPNIICWSTAWTPPAQYKANNKLGGGDENNRFLGAESGEPNWADIGYANYLVEYIQYCRSRGIELYAISPQNEPDWNPDYESCLWTAGQFEVFVRALYSALQNAGLNTKIMIPDTVNNYGFRDRASTTMNTLPTANYVGILATHLYGALPQPLSSYGFRYVTNQEWWETEISGSAGGIPEGLEVAHWIHECFVNANMNGFHYWWINDLIVDNVPQMKFYVLGNYSKFIRPGFYRVAASSQPTSGVFVSAYKNSNTSPSRVVIVAFNINDSSVNQTFIINGVTISTATPWLTTSSVGLVRQQPLVVTNNRITYNMPARSVVTFVCSVSGTTYNLTTSVNPSGAGSVSLNPSGGVYVAGTTVTVTAVSNSGWVFLGWSGDVSGNQNPISIVMNGNRSVTANFVSNNEWYFNVSNE